MISFLVGPAHYSLQIITHKLLDADGSWSLASRHASLLNCFGDVKRNISGFSRVTLDLFCSD